MGLLNHELYGNQKKKKKGVTCPPVEQQLCQSLLKATDDSIALGSIFVFNLINVWVWLSSY